VTEGVGHLIERRLALLLVERVDVGEGLPLLVAEEVEVVVDRLAVLVLAEVCRGTLVDRAVLVVRGRGVGEELLRRFRTVAQRFQHGGGRVVAGTVHAGGVVRVLERTVHHLVPGEQVRVLLVQLRHVFGDGVEEPRVVVPVPHDPAEQLVSERPAIVVLGQRNVLGAQLAELRPPLVGELLVVGGVGQVEAQVLLELLDVLEALGVDLAVLVRVRGKLAEERERLLGAELLVEALGKLHRRTVVLQQLVELL
jgi:hypothetical protein